MSSPYPSDTAPSDTAPSYRPKPTLPKPPAESAAYSFPLLATLAPVLGSGVIWAITHSPFALVFAFLGPLIAVASRADSSVQGRRRRRRERARFEAEVTVTLASIAEWHAVERVARDARHPGIRAVLASASPRLDGWNEGERSEIVFSIGRGAVPSALRFDGTPVVDRIADPGVAKLLDSVMDAAIRLEDAAILIDARLGVGICGTPSAARAAARACVLQLAGIMTPVATVIRSTGGADWDWLDALPHRREVLVRPPGEEFIEFVINREVSERSGLGSASVVLVVAERVDELPRRCRVVVVAGAGRPAQLEERGSHEAVRNVELHFATAEEALMHAIALRRCAEADGFLPSGFSVPQIVSFDSLVIDPRGGRVLDGRTRDSLRCAIGYSGTELWEVDLVADGPHAVVGGTTGSGKSELLITWVLSMAGRYSPEQVTFLLVDFKGGASFTAVSSLPHSVGLITDLDPPAAHRALESLRAELLFRERALVSAGARAIEELPADVPLARLVIVIDEYAALGNDFPELHVLFADLASRGRSLGIHLILCTQRPAGAIRDSILANCTLRVALRLNNRADSIAVIGTGAAADLPREPRGRALTARAGEEPIMVQVAIASREKAVVIGESWHSERHARRPWCDPLPPLIPFVDLAPVASGFAIGRIDLPSEQRQETLAYVAERDGNLLVLGAHGSGKSSALRALAEGASPSLVNRVPHDVEGAWDALVDVAEYVASGTSAARPLLVVLDDADSLITRFGQDHQLEFVDMLSMVLREGPGRGVTVVIAAQRLPAALQVITSLCDSQLLLRMPNRQDHLLAGGRGDQHDPHLPPGGGFWREHRVQIGYVAPSAPSTPSTPSTPSALSSSCDPSTFSPSTPLELIAGGTTAVISASPRVITRRLSILSGVRVVDVASWDRTPGGSVCDLSDPTAPAVHTVVVGSPDDWQAGWALLSSLQGRVQMVFDGCRVSEYRAISRSRLLPPPLSHPGSVWLLSPDGRIGRASLPTGPVAPECSKVMSPGQ